MDRLILVVFLATILAISHVSRYLPGACRLVFITGLYLWHPSCFLHHRHPTVAAALPAMHRSDRESLTQSCPACYWPPAAANLLGLSDGWSGEWRHLHGPRWVSNCSTVVTVIEVGCGPLLISYRQHLSATYTGHVARSPTRFGLADDSLEKVDRLEPYL